MYRFKRIVVKIGSNVLTQSDGTLDLKRIESIVTDIALMHKAGIEIILVSSGAVASGRSELKIDKNIVILVANPRLYHPMLLTHLIYLIHYLYSI